MKVLVVSGFLGAGKTRFITSMARVSRRGFAVMENEMGAVGVDGGFLSSALGAGAEVWELTEGCICCSMKADFAASVLTIENALRPDYLVVEPTGVGLLSRVMANLRQIAYERIELLAPVTIVDARNYRFSARDFPQIFSDQLAAAATVVFSKAEHLLPEERDELERLVKSYAPAAEIVSQPYGLKPPAWWESLWLKALDGSILKDEPLEASDQGLDVLSLNQGRLSSPAALAVFLEKLLRGGFGSIVRAKGTIEAAGHGLRFDVAGGQYSLTGAEDSCEVKAVFIGRDLNRQALREALAAREAERAR